MNCPEYIREALSRYTQCFDADGMVAVSTQCLYPSNGGVTVFITGGPEGCRVSDEGRAITEITHHGLEVRNPENYLRQFCAPRGLKWAGPKIHSPTVPAAGLPAAISMVASASSLAAHWGVHNLKTRARRDLRRELHTALGLRFAEDRIRQDVRLAGHSGRQYRFEFVVELGGERRLIVDPVTPEPAAINARAIAHFDLARAENPLYVQRLVYDEVEDWEASDINLLRMAAELVPLAAFGGNVDRLVPHP